MASKGKASTGQSGRTKSPKARGTDIDKEQSKRFKETARELGVDESGDAFEKAVGILVRNKRGVGV